MAPRHRSLTTRLTLSHLLATTVALLLLGAALLVLLLRAQQTQTQAALEAQAALYAAYAVDLAPTTAILEGVADRIVRRFPPPPGTTVRIFATNGALLTADQSLGQFPSRAVRALVVSPAPILTLAPQRRHYAAQPIIRGGEQIGVVEVSIGAAAGDATRRQFLAALLPAALLALGGALILARLLARSLLRPLVALGRVADKIAAGDLRARAAGESGDEIGRLAAQINRMAADLESRFEQIERLNETRREFYRSVSHELRTPLTAIRGIAENLEDSASREQQASLLIMQTEVGRLQRLVDELLKGGEQSFSPIRERQPIAMRALAADVVALMQPRAGRSGVDLRYRSRTDSVISGDADRLRQALVNLLDNALKWTPAGGSVTVEVFATDSAGERALVVSVADTGSGIPPDQQAALWERGNAGAIGGQGLGLALVREVVSAHGGEARLVGGPGTTIELRFPLAAKHRSRIDASSSPGG